MKAGSLPLPAFLFLTVGCCAAAQTPAALRSGSWQGREVVYRVVDGLAVAEGDILLGTEAELAGTPKSGGTRQSLVRASGRFLWPDGVVPYAIDADLPEPARVTAAVEHWNNAGTPIRLVPRTSESAFVRFVKNDNTCSSFVGRNGREQAIRLADWCSTGSVIHEIGHAVGLFHEQSRLDRDFFLAWLPENVDKRELSNFAQAIGSGQDMGAYDFSSIMHYDVTGFSRNGRPVLKTIPAGLPIGQRERLSPGDLDAVRRLYGSIPAETTISTSPLGMEVEVDGARVKAPFTVRWEPGSQHTIAAPGPQGQGNVRYVFGRWSDEGAASHTVTASADTTVYSVAFIRQYRMPLGVTPAAGGRLQVTPQPPDGWFDSGAEVEIRAVPNPGYEFRQWSGFGMFGTHGVSPNPLRVVVLGVDLRYTANFTTAPVTLLTSDPPGLKINVDGETVTTPRGYSWTAGSSHKVEVVEVTQTPGAGTARYAWKGWSNDGDQSQTLVAGERSSVLTAKFLTSYQVTRMPTQGGTLDVTPAGDNEFWEAGTVLTLRPTVAGGTRFFSWTGDARGSDEPGSLLVDDQKIVGATFAAPRQIASGGIVNGASFLPGAGVAPGSIITIFGAEIGPHTLETLRLDAQNRVQTSLSGYSILFDDIPAPLLYVSRDQIAAVAPWSLAGQTETVVRVAGPGWTSPGRTVPIKSAGVALFTADASGQGAAAALNQNGTINSAASPAERGSVVVLYGTGGGAMQPALQDGMVPSGALLSHLTSPVRVRICGLEAPVHYAGVAPGLVAGVLQINAQIPRECAPGSAPVILRVGDSVAQPGVLLHLQ